MVEVNVVSDDRRLSWDVSSGGQALCSTPCVQWFDERADLLLESSRGEELYLPSLSAEAPTARSIFVVAEPTSRAKRVNGIVFTTLGGMGVVTAITFTAVGCSDLERRGGACTAGLITGAVSIPLTAAAIWLMLDAAPRAPVLPVLESRASARRTPDGVAVSF
jgi:hypothetical protein